MSTPSPSTPASPNAPSSSTFPAKTPSSAVASAHKQAVLDLITTLVAQLDVAEPATLARQLKLLLEGAIATALVDPGPQPARDARTAAATLLATHSRH